ncbi:MAG TPA: DUF1801 domain-containing protein [Candidatus Eisenbacteria bacterium]|nr:DUF1801 domain-containing protein [Candidatus Eisenbacteria bacterium]
MPEPKTRPTTASVAGFIRRQPDEQTRADCRTLVALMKQVTRKKPVMWGPSIIGFGTWRLVYADGSGADWPIAGFSPRKKDLTIYLMGVFDRHPELMKKLGRHRTGKVCLYIRRLADVDVKVLKELVVASVRYGRERHR